MRCRVESVREVSPLLKVNRCAAPLSLSLSLIPRLLTSVGTASFSQQACPPAHPSIPHPSLRSLVPLLQLLVEGCTCCTVSLSFLDQQQQQQQQDDTIHTPPLTSPPQHTHALHCVASECALCLISTLPLPEPVVSLYSCHLFIFIHWREGTRRTPLCALALDTPAHTHTRAPTLDIAHLQQYTHLHTHIEREREAHSLSRK